MTMEESTHNGTTASLRIHSSTLLPAEITKVLRTTPTSIWGKGALMSPRNPDSRRRETSIWLLESGLPDSAELEDHIAYLVTFLEEHLVQFKAIQADCTIDIFCGFFSYQSQGHFSLDHILMKRLVALEGDLVFDIYGTHDQE